jgi:hypothetical protein
MNLEEYDAIFEKRGLSYHDAMRRHPDARNTEFDALFARRTVKHGETVLDIPAGGGYLARRLPANTSVTELELTSGFTPDLMVVPTHGDWGVGKFDHTVCLAALHHISDQERFVAQLVAHTGPGGTVHIADVDAETSITEFLDGFVGRYNITGHKGKYLTERSFLSIPDARLIANEIRSCPWRFSNEAAALDFAASLFGLVDYPRAAFREAVVDRVGLNRDGAEITLDWRLRYIDLAVG